ncbi:condensation domain-containing protein [Calothrix rhizosoleniae]|uniref:condensation domain-containing protein n=1 Tax=Calothrix rhizosoleniae TaxID=888997 RepID=UPI000B49CE5C|nr:condensation domain-containing protein [Calothrix rhizosoleniae]
MANTFTQSKFILVPVDFDPFAEGELLLTSSTTDSQKEIWGFVEMGKEANCAFNLSTVLKLRGSFNVAALRSAFGELITRHEALRTTFSPDGATLCVTASLTIEIPLIDLSGLGSQERERQWDLIRQQAVEQPFDLVYGPLLRVQIVRMQGEEHWVIFTAHHIIFDGWSWGVLFSELGIIYSAFRRGLVPQLPEPDRFSEYALLEQQQATEPEYLAAEQYWLKKFSDKIPVLKLPTDRPRPSRRSFKAAREDREINTATVKTLKKIGAKYGCTFVTTMTAAFEVFLSRITGQEDLVVGIAAAGQSVKGKSNLIGYCLNILPSRTYVDGRASFSEYLRSRRATLLDDYEHQQVTCDSLLKKLIASRDRNQFPFVSVRFNIDRILENQLPRLEGLEIEVFSNPRAFDNFELFIDALETEKRFQLKCYYDTDLFDAQTIQGRLEEFEVLLADLANNPKRRWRLV